MSPEVTVIVTVLIEELLLLLIVFCQTDLNLMRLFIYLIGQDNLWNNLIM